MTDKRLLTDAEILRRRAVLGSIYERELPYKVAALDLGLSTSGLNTFMTAHAQDLQRMFRSDPRYRSGRRPRVKAA